MATNNNLIIFKVKLGGNVKNMIKIMNQLKKAKRPVIIEADFIPSMGKL